MAITELRYGGKQSYNVEFVEKIPEDKIVLLKHKAKEELYILTDITFNGIYQYSITPLCSVKNSKNRYCHANQINIFEDYEVIALTSLKDFKNIDCLAFCN